MNKKFVSLDYTFLFEAGSAWTRLSDFENDLSEFLGAYGMDAEIVNSITGQIGRRILLVRPMDKLTKLNNLNQPTKGVTK